MKLAYLLFVYRNPKLIKRVVERLSCEDSSFFVHVDGKSELRQFDAIRTENVFFTHTRIPVYWAEFSGVEAILLLIRHALSAPQRYDYLVLMSGSEYPLRSREYIHNFFELNAGVEFITMVKMPSEKAGKPLSRINTWRFPSTRPCSRFAFRLLAKVGLATRDYRKSFGALDPYSGHTWWALSADACHYLLNFRDRDTKLARFFENAFAPEETYLQTILGNSPFRSRVRRNLVFEDWSSGGGHPAMIAEQHLSFFEAQEAVSVQDLHGPGELLFARKLADDRLHLAERIDKMIERKERRACLA
jgi:hypothetical protein